MPETIESAKRHRRRQAVLSTLINGFLLLFSAFVLLIVRGRFDLGGFLSGLLVFFAAVNTICILPLAYSLRERLQEIQGGEEDEACHY
ncbi:hypothetical protein KQI82_03185 [Oscillibacter sp. MSJ-2]|uniref:Uncharacterized protein n=1 Tax=Dysosmobacter acutus TaxID=2841504 RepID=A0ABS6F8N6_9FIRM|nr:hypothetical protein [Dysosmobacter acutus]MBU5625942.1 hypothetical protein [Dysosmobacter acutus]